MFADEYGNHVASGLKIISVLFCPESIFCLDFDILA
jgi:hypothetical protein